MNIELQKKLYESYPRIFVDADKSVNESCMAWGIECGDGWYNIIDTLCQSMSHCYTTSIRIEAADSHIANDEPFFTINPPTVIATQVKEKFGTLRFYYSLKYDAKLEELDRTGKYPDIKSIKDRYYHYIDGMVHFAEMLSARTCEITGKEGEMHVSGGTRRGWYKVLNREFAKTDEEFASREYVPVKDIPRDEEL